MIVQSLLDFGRLLNGTPSMMIDTLWLPLELLGRQGRLNRRLSGGAEQFLF